MRLAFLLYEYFPYGGLQRNFHLLLEELQQRGHLCRVYCISWQGEELAGVDIRRVSASAFTRPRREQRFLQRVHTDLAAHPVDGVIGFNSMPQLDIYFSAGCHNLERSLRQRSRLFRRSAKFRHEADWERAVFGPESDTQVLLTTDSERDKFAQYYHTAPQRLHLLPPGVDSRRRAPDDASERRKAVRATLGLETQVFTLLFVGSNFSEKGLDRAITTLAHLRAEQPSITSRLLVAGIDKPRRFKRLAGRLGVGEGVEFLGGRDDVADLMLGADLLVHPAVSEVPGIVLLEALAAGLPVVATDVCGHAHHVKAARAGILLSSPFSQEQLDRAVMRYIDGVFRAECRSSALLYARLTDLYAMHREGADLVEKLIRPRSGRRLMPDHSQ